MSGVFPGCAFFMASGFPGCVSADSVILRCLLAGGISADPITFVCSAAAGAPPDSVILGVSAPGRISPDSVSLRRSALSAVSPGRGSLYSITPGCGSLRSLSVCIIFSQIRRRCPRMPFSLTGNRISRRCPAYSLIPLASYRPFFPFSVHLSFS